MKLRNDVASGSVDDIRIERIRRNIAVFNDSNRVPVPVGDLTVVAAARNAHRAAFLLAGANAIGERGRDADVIQLRRWLIEPGAPGLAPVQCHDGALITDESEGVGICWADPDVLIVISAWCAPQRSPGRTAIHR